MSCSCPEKVCLMVRVWISQTYSQMNDQWRPMDENQGMLNDHAMECFTYPNQLVFSSSGQVSSIRTEADTANVQIPILVHGIILEVGHLITSVDIENLR